LEWRNLTDDPRHAAVKAELAAWLPAENVPDGTAAAGTRKCERSGERKRAAAVE
jgi:hypothetical protein